MSQPDLDKLLPKLINLRARCEHEGLSMDFETVSEALSLLEGMRWRSVGTEPSEGLKLYFGWESADEVNEGGFYYALSKEKAMPWATLYLPITPPTRPTTGD